MILHHRTFARRTTTSRLLPIDSGFITKLIPGFQDSSASGRIHAIVNPGLLVLESVVGAAADLTEITAFSRGQLPYVTRAGNLYSRMEHRGRGHSPR